MFPFLHSFPHCSMASFGFHESQHIVALHRKGRTGRDTLDHLGRGHKPGRILLLECFLNLCLQKQQQPGCWALQCSCSVSSSAQTEPLWLSPPASGCLCSGCGSCDLIQLHKPTGPPHSRSAETKSKQKLVGHSFLRCCLPSVPPGKSS